MQIGPCSLLVEHIAKQVCCVLADWIACREWTTLADKSSGSLLPFGVNQCRAKRGIVQAPPKQLAYVDVSRHWHTAGVSSVAPV